MQTFTTPAPPKLTQSTERIASEAALKDYLSQFISWALRITASGECSGDTAIALLDQAWVAQKLLWRLRD